MYFIMRQVSKYSWQILSSKGNIIQDGIYLNNVEDAKAYVKAYTSSYHAAEYRIEAASNRRL